VLQLLIGEGIRLSRWRHGAKPVIGLVGGIGAGKSTAARIFEQFGGVVIDADAIGHSALARIVFANPDDRNALEGMVFPYIEERCLEIIKASQNDEACRYVVLDAAVMLEAGWNDVADRIVFLDAPREERLARVAARGWTESDLAARERAQWPLELKMQRADAVLDNSHSPAELKDQIDRLLRDWKVLTG
jgi:dephospho-CoA kinase